MKNSVSRELFAFGLAVMLACGMVFASPAATTQNIDQKEVSTGKIERSGKLSSSDKTTMGPNTVYGRFFNFKAVANGTAKIKSSNKDCMYFLSEAGSKSQSQPQSLSVKSGKSYVINVVGKKAGVSYSFTVSVPKANNNKSKKTLKSISITGGASSIKAGKSTTFKCKAKFSDGTTATVSPQWSIVSGGSYASISSSGKLTTKVSTSKRSVKIKAVYTYNGVTKSSAKTVTIKPVAKALKSITVTYYPKVYSGNAKQFSCKAEFNTGATSDVTGKTKWKITSGGSYASITSSGKFTAKTTSVQRTVKVQAQYTYSKKTLKLTVTVTILPSVSSIARTAHEFSGASAALAGSGAKAFEGLLENGDGMFSFSADAGSETGYLVVAGDEGFSGVCGFVQDGSRILVETDSGLFAIWRDEDGVTTGGWYE